MKLEELFNYNYERLVAILLPKRPPIFKRVSELSCFFGGRSKIVQKMVFFGLIGFGLIGFIQKLEIWNLKIRPWWCFLAAPNNLEADEQ